MHISAEFVNTALPTKGTIAVVIQGDKLGEAGQALDKATGGAVKRAMLAHEFKGKLGASLAITGTEFTRIVLVSSGDKADEASLLAAGGHLYAAIASTKAEKVAVAVDVKASNKKDNAAALVAHGAVLRSYDFDKYRTKVKPEDKPKLKTIVLHGKDIAATKKAYAPLEAESNAVFFTRDLVSEPANIIYPETFVKQCEAMKALGVKIEVLDYAAIKKLKMGALIGVAQGSVREPRVLVLKWEGGPKNKAPIAFVGKGVTFDTGGISIKPAGGMEEMKWDMGGAGAVAGAMMALAGRKAKVNVIGICGLVENMPDGNAQRPGDIVTSMSGQTIEVLNTDAEGRLVLCDCLTYVQRTHKPSLIVDLATLTGAVIVALGHDYAGIMSNNDKLTKQLTDAGAATGEKLWRLPLGDYYHRGIDSPIADMKNIGPPREAGSTEGAVFLERFIEDKLPWAHLDIAGTAWAYKDVPLCRKGASAYGVRLLNRFVAENYE